MFLFDRSDCVENINQSEQRFFHLLHIIENQFHCFSKHEKSFYTKLSNGMLISCPEDKYFVNYQINGELKYYKKEARMERFESSINISSMTKDHEIQFIKIEDVSSHHVKYKIIEEIDNRFILQRRSKVENDHLKMTDIYIKDKEEILFYENGKQKTTLMNAFFVKDGPFIYVEKEDNFYLYDEKKDQFYCIEGENLKIKEILANGIHGQENIILVPFEEKTKKIKTNTERMMTSLEKWPLTKEQKKEVTNSLQLTYKHWKNVSEMLENIVKYVKEHVFLQVEEGFCYNEENLLEILNCMEIPFQLDNYKDEMKKTKVK